MSKLQMAAILMLCTLCVVIVINNPFQSFFFSDDNPPRKSPQSTSGKTEPNAARNKLTAEQRAALWSDSITTKTGNARGSVLIKLSIDGALEADLDLLQRILELSPGSERLELISHYLNSFRGAPELYAQVIETVSQYVLPEEKNRLIGSILDSLRPIDYYKTLTDLVRDPVFKAPLWRMYGGKFADTHPDEVLNYAATLKDHEQDYFLEGASQNLINRDLGKFAAAFPTLPLKDKHLVYAGKICAQDLAQQSYPTAIDWIKRIPKAEVATPIFEYTIRNWLDFNSIEASQYIKDHDLPRNLKKAGIRAIIGHLKYLNDNDAKLWEKELDNYKD